MRSRSESTITLAGGQAALVAAALLVAACATPEAPPAARVEPGPDGGFTIAEELRVAPSVRADFTRALELLEGRRYPEGIELLSKVVTAAPGATAAHIDLGIAYGLMGEWENAEASLDRARQLNPRHPVVHNELGIVYRRTGRFREARASYEQALALHPEFHFAHRNLAILCDLYLADRDCALEHYESYSGAVPDDATAAMWATDLRTRGGR